jgi:ubiquinone/menaquinone biosynthesis C-methylase UbiE/uncharacterized protein YbaR (Trm112 family)
MKYRLVELLQSVPDVSQLRVASVREVRTVSFTDRLSEVKCRQFCAFKNCQVKDANVTPQDCNKCYSQEIIEGELLSESGKRYPISGGIPRLLSGEGVDFLKRNKKSFSLEWKYFRFGERNWGMDIESRKDLFIKALGKDPKELQGKLILDAGCGSGLLSIEMAKSFGMEVVALDLATGTEKAFERNQNPYVYFVQGSVLEPPIKNGVADYIYCAGVLIHLPDTRKGFGALPRCLKIGGRYFVWVYHEIEAHMGAKDRITEALYDLLRSKITSHLPISVQEAAYVCLALPFVMKRMIGNLVRKTNDTRTWREKMQNLIDTFSPVYANRHTEEEVIGWYRECHLSNEVVAYHDRYGFGVRGDLLRSEN